MTRNMKYWAVFLLLGSVALPAGQSAAGDNCASKIFASWVYYYDRECEKRISFFSYQKGLANLKLNVVFAPRKGKLASDSPPSRIYFYSGMKLTGVSVRLGGEALTQSKAVLGPYENHEIVNPESRARLFRTLRRGGSIDVEITNEQGRRGVISFSGANFSQAYQRLQSAVN